MGNIDTYIKEYGDQTFAERPLGDVDSLVLSYLVYYWFDGIVPTPAEGGSIPLADAAAQYAEKVGTRQDFFVAPSFLADLARTARFGRLALSRRVDVFHKQVTQFSALCIALPDGTHFVTYRGVDSTLTGWEEAVSGSYRDTPAHKMAAEYLERVLPEITAEEPAWYLGGHSKGGHLAEYALLHAEKQYRDTLRMLYLLDSPGLRPDSYDHEIRAEIAPRTRRITPAFNMVDSVFRDTPPDRVIVSMEEGLAQHKPYAWAVEGGDFVEVPDAEPEAKQLQALFASWIASSDLEERRHFVRCIFRSMREQRDAGNPPDFERISSLLKFVVRTWAHGTLPAKRAIRKLVTAGGHAWLETKREQAEHRAD